MEKESLNWTGLRRTASRVVSAIVAIATSLANGAAPPIIPVPTLETLPAWAKIQTPPTKRALVIGIGTYQHAPPLKTPPFDASLVESTLTSVDPNFIITRVPKEKGSRGSLLDAISTFAKSIRPGDVAFVYFSGHGLERDTVNYLVPIEADAATPGREGFVYVSLPYLIEQIQLAKPGITVVILDACRADPFSALGASADELDPPNGAELASGSSPSAGASASSPVNAVAQDAAASAAASAASSPKAGLSEIKPPNGFYVAYAAAPGMPSFSLFRGDDPKAGSIFTRRLLNFLVTVNKPVFNVFGATSGDVSRLTGEKQTPFLNTFNAGEVLLSKNVHLEADEEETWIRTVAQAPVDQQPSALRGFLDLYPAGPFASAARKRIEDLEQGTPQPAPVASVIVEPAILVSGALRTPAIAQANASIAIASRDVFVRAAPQPAFPGVLATLRKGEEVQVLAAETRPGWAKIALRNGGVGYVGSVATPTIPVKPNDLVLKLVGDDLPDITQGPFKDQWQAAFRQSSVVVHIDSGPAVALNAWRARQVAYLRALRVRAALVAQGANNARVTVTLGNDKLRADTTIVTATRLDTP